MSTARPRRTGWPTTALLARSSARFYRRHPAQLGLSLLGIVLGTGRAGAIAGPVLAGYLLEAQIPLAQVAIIISMGSVMAAIAIFLLGAKAADEDA